MGSTRTLAVKTLVAKTLAAALFSAALIGFAAPDASEAKTIPTGAGKHCGGASWYALNSRTASGEMMDPSAMTAAHRSLPFGTKLRVTHKRSGRWTIVRINDRGPFIKGRILDLSKAAADRLGFIRAGHAEICLEVIS